jgi:DMSO/TMAO reductase YedYZ molybdopterin-dependent catalytic subunit
MSSKLPPLKEEEIEVSDLRKKTRRSFLTAGIFGLLGVISIRGLLNMEKDRGIPWLLRKLNDLTDSFWNANSRDKALVAEVKPDGKPFRVNGDVGLEAAIDESAWRLHVEDPSLDEPLQISIQEIRKLPATKMSFDFKCIEGWSQAIECRGVKLSDFMQAYQIGRSDWSEDDIEYRHPFAALTSVNGGYYVSMDANSFWHPQTLLCYEINGQALTAEHGAPLRLMSAVKYGVKNIKQIGKIAFVSSPPADYWAENGYQETLMF